MATEVHGDDLAAAVALVGEAPHGALQPDNLASCRIRHDHHVEIGGGGERFHQGMQHARIARLHGRDHPFCIRDPRRFTLLIQAESR